MKFYILSSLSCLLMFLSVGCNSDQINDDYTLDFSSWTDNKKSALSLEADFVPDKSPSLPELPADSTLDDYIEYAQKNNPGLKAVFNQWKAALEQIPQDRALPDPRFTYEYFIEEVETRVGPQRQSFAVSQAFPWFGKLQRQEDTTAQAAKAKQQQFENTRLQLIQKVKSSWYEYYYISRAVSVAEENLTLLKHFEEVVQTRYTTAAATHPDIIRIQIEVGKLNDQLASLKDLRNPAQARLNAALNRPIDTPIPPIEEISLADPEINDEQVLAEIQSANPQLKEYDHQIAQKQAQIELAQKQYYPDINLGLKFIDTDDSSAAVRPSDSGKDPVIAMVSVNLPIWHDKYAAAVRQSRFEKNAARQMKTEKTNMLLDKAKTALYYYRDAQRKIDLYENLLIPRATESIKVTESAYLSGKQDFLQMIDTQRTLLEFQLALTRARADYGQRLAELETLTARSLE